MDDLDSRVRQLEARTRRLEDEIALYQLVSRYGPAADACANDEVVALWTEDGVYDHSTFRLEGRDGIAEMLDGDQHQDNVRRGSAHVISQPHLHVDGDRAVATTYSQLFIHDDDGGWRVRWASANRWECARGDDGWHVVRRTTRALDGSPDGPDLFRRSLEES